MRVLGICSYPVEAAATRFRMAQFVEPLREHGIELEISPFLDGKQFKAQYQQGSIARKGLGLIGPVIKRFGEPFKTRQYDAIFVQREAMFFGPGVFEWLHRTIGRRPMILDLDDATYVRYTSPTYGQIGSFFKFFGKTDNLIRRSAVVTCGNRFIAEYAESLGARTVVIPTVVDTDIFCPAEKNNDPPVIGWIGTHSTFPFLESLFPVLERLAEKHKFVLKIVGSGRDKVELNGVEVRNLPWDLNREPEDFRTLDIGLYPLATTENYGESWLLGKSGFKAIEYMAAGVPFVVTPIGICGEIGDEGKTHFNATSADEWYASLERLLSQTELRSRMGTNARSFSTEHYAPQDQAERLATVFREVSRSDVQHTSAN